MPWVLESAAVKMLKVVDFPAPLGPKSPKVSPNYTEKLLFLMATYPLGNFLKRLSTTIGEGIVIESIFVCYFIKSYDLWLYISSGLSYSLSVNLNL